MSFWSRRDLEEFGFAYLGNNVLISRKASIYHPELQSYGHNSRVDDFCTVSGRVTLGRNVHLSVGCNFAGGDPGITVGDFSGFAYGCQVFTQSADYLGNSLTNPTVPAHYRKEEWAPVSVGRHVAVGVNCVIFPGVRIGEGSSFGASAVIRESVAPWGVYLGNPPRRINERSQDLLKFEQMYLSEEEPLE